MQQKHLKSRGFDKIQALWHVEKRCAKRTDRLLDMIALNAQAYNKPSWLRPLNHKPPGWRGIMFESGSVWLEDYENITAVNHQAAAEKELLRLAVLADNAALPRSLRNFKKPEYLIVTKHYRICIDELDDGTHRYASWKLRAKRGEPELVLRSEGGDVGGTMPGNHAFEFKHGSYTYEVSIGARIATEAMITVLKSEQRKLSEAGRIIRK